jgi:AcrR family transcriptional regulator
MAEAGLARTVFYRHFDGLAAIVIGLLDDLLALDEAAHHDDAVERAYHAWLDHTVEVSAELIERGHTPPMPVREVARALTAMNAHYLLELVARDPSFDADAALEALWAVWMRTTWP